MRAWKVVLWYLLFGLLPLWLGLAWMFAGARHGGSDYWNVAPWLAVAGVVYSVPTLAIACIAHLAYRYIKARRDPVKRAAAWTAMLLPGSVMLVVAVLIWIANDFFP